MHHVSNQPKRAAHHIEDNFPRLGPSVMKSVVNPTVTGLVIGILFVTVFLAAFHAPEPHNLPVGIVGASQQVKAVEQAVAENAPGKLEFITYDSAAEARDAVEHRTIFGAYVVAEDGQTAQLLYAGANGPGVTSTVEGIFGGVAHHSNIALKTQDVVPAASGDTRGLGIFYAGFGIVLGGFLLGLISAQMAPNLQLRWRILSLGLFSIIGGAAVSLIAGSTGFNVLPGNLAVNISVIALLAAAVIAGTLLLLHLGGAAGTLLACRYANHKGGKKYDGPVPDDKKGQSGAHGRDELPRQKEDPVKAESARIFKAKWDLCRENKTYLAMKKKHRDQYKDVE